MSNSVDKNEHELHAKNHSCYRVTKLISLSQERPLHAGEKLSMYTHMMMCNGCRNYAKNNKNLSNILKTYKNTSND